MTNSQDDNSPESWEEKVARKRAQCAKAIPKEWQLPQEVWDRLPIPLETSKVNLIGLDIPRRSGILTERELTITEKYNVQQLLKRLASGEYSALEVTIAFSKRAAICQQLTQCLTETMFEEAQERAKSLDKLRSGGQLAGPLHGLPISIKDTFQVAGTQATIGLVAYLDKHSTDNSPLVDILLKLGAVLYVKTNVPQTLMTVDSHNNIFGRTLNPHNTALTAGGSSGGEAALVAFRGSPLGVGTDIAGSVRLPALCCGTYGFRPTISRIPFGGQAMCADPGLRPIVPCAGPLANDLDAVELFMKTVIEAEPTAYDSTAIYAPWRTDGIRTKAKLRLGVVSEDPTFPLHPPVKKAFMAAVNLLREAGHEIIELTPEEASVANMTEIAWGLFSLDTTAQQLVLEGGEPLIPSVMSIMEEAVTLPLKFLPGLADKTNFEKFSALNNLRIQHTAQWHNLWAKYQFDAVISPGNRCTAVEHDRFAAPPYTVFLNVLDYPAIVLPQGNIPDKDDGTIFKAKPAQPEYNHEMLKGAPLSIQVFTNRMRDEECIAAARVVDACIEPLRQGPQTTGRQTGWVKSAL